MNHARSVLPRLAACRVLSVLSRPAARRALCILLLASAAPPGAPLSAQTASDCFPDRIAAFSAGFTSSPPLFNSWQPGIVLGPPGNSTPTNGTLTVMSLGRGGSIVLEFTDNLIVDGPGPDFILFENPFFCTAVPQTAADPYSVFAEPGIVAVSEDGIDFRTFPYDEAALSQVVQQCTDRSLIERLRGVMGITPNFSGNYTVPDDPLVFDAAAPGGISGHGGDAFDLAAVGLARARFVRITDPDLPISLPGSSEGLDFDAVGAIHARPLPPVGAADADGDGLTDEAEIHDYLTDPARADSDGDGVEDGEEAAGCRSPLATGPDPFFLPVLDLEVAQPSPTVVRWNILGQGIAYDVIRGDLAVLRSGGSFVDLGVVTCIEDNSGDLTTRTLPDGAVPFAGEAFFYLVRQNPPGSGLGYGRSSAQEPRLPASGDCR